MDSNEDYIRLEQSSGKREDFRRKPKFRVKTENVKKGRLIIRNLSFKVTEEQLRAEFEKHGKISEVNLLKKPDGKLVGCAFIQYFDYNDSTKAIKSMNGKDFLKRKITVDFAVSKNRYTNTHKPDDEGDSIKQESDDPEVKQEDEIKSEDEQEEEGASDSEDGEEEDIKSEDDSEQEAVEVKKEKKFSDSDNEFTVFVKNLNFDTTNEDLLECFKKFGPIKYALVVKDHVSGHSKGTGFVKFLRKESVEMCIGQSGKINLQDFALEVLPTLSKQTVKNIEKQKETSKTQTKDNRNLYLMREGMIIAGSTASEGVSATDMATRLRLEQLKSQMLKNLTRFISRERLTIHNLPETCDDAKLRKIVESRTKQKPIECRVMRENKPSATHPNGKSKGFGFLAFKRHEIALDVLRKLNNNPEVFSANHRPIVSFSIEDMNVLKIKEKRQQRSMLNNPTYQKKLENIKAKKLAKRMEKKDKKSSVALTTPKKQRKAKSDEPAESYSGFASKPGAFVKLRSTFKLKEQSRIHEKTMKERNKKVRREKQLSDVLKEKSQKKFERASQKRKFNEIDTLASKISKYKSLVNVEPSASKRPKTRGKWYMD